MLNAKVKLDNLRVKSFVTVLDGQQQQQAQGGYFVVKGKKSKTDRFSWNVTVIDIREDGFGVTGRRGSGNI
jgi:hypothetical protein